MLLYNPFVQAYWGNMDNLNVRLPDPSFIEYLVLDRLHVSSEMQPMVDALIVPGGEFQTVMAAENVLVAKRVRPPSVRSPPPIPTAAPVVNGVTVAPPATGVIVTDPPLLVDSSAQPSVVISPRPLVDAGPAPARTEIVPGSAPLRERNDLEDLPATVPVR